MIHLLARVTFRLLISHRFLLRQSGEGLKTHGLRNARGWFQPSRTEYIIHNVVVTMVVMKFQFGQNAGVTFLALLFSFLFPFSVPPVSPFLCG